MSRHGTLGRALLACLVAWPAAAQTGPGTARSCNQTNADADFRRVRSARGEETIFISGPARFVCTGGTIVEADSAVWRRTTGAMELIGDVLYRDSAQALTSDWANYLGAESALYARGSVVFTDRVNGSEVRGEQLEYLQASEERPTSRAVVQGGRPHAVLRPAGDSAAATDTTPPIEVDADWMEFLGDSLFTARDDVVILRGTTQAFAAYAEFDQGGEGLMLRDSARVEDPEYRLRGDRIDALFAGDALRQVWAQGNADLDAESLLIRAPRLVVGFVDGEVETLSAWVPFVGDTIGDPVLTALSERDTAVAPVEPGEEAGQGRRGAQADTIGAPAEAGEAAVALEDTAAVPLVPDQVGLPPDARRMGPDSAGRPERAPERERNPDRSEQAQGQPRVEGVRAVAVAEGFRLEADSIRALAPGQALERVTAVGSAYGERGADSLAMTLPAEISRDWVEGDTIIGLFTEGPAAGTPPSAPGMAADSAEAPRSERTLERVVVVGRPARSLYRMQQEGPGAPDRPGVNYMTAARITLHLVEGDVSRVDADGPIEGIFLDPERPQVAPADSAGPTLPGDSIPPPAATDTVPPPEVGV